MLILLIIIFKRVSEFIFITIKLIYLLLLNLFMNLN